MNSLIHAKNSEIIANFEDKINRFIIDIWQHIFEAESNACLYKGCSTKTLLNYVNVNHRVNRQSIRHAPKSRRKLSFCRNHSSDDPKPIHLE